MEPEFTPELIRIFRLRKVRYAEPFINKGKNKSVKAGQALTILSRQGEKGEVYWFWFTATSDKFYVRYRIDNYSPIEMHDIETFNNAGVVEENDAVWCQTYDDGVPIYGLQSLLVLPYDSKIKIELVNGDIETKTVNAFQVKGRKEPMVV